MGVELSGWRSSQDQTSEGAVESEQRVGLRAPVVPFDEAGARRLGHLYWAEVERSSLGLVRRDAGSDGLALRFLGRRPVLLRFGLPVHEVSGDAVSCRYPIAGGILTQRCAGEISFSQARGTDGLELRSAIRDFFPTLAAREGEPHWTGTLYKQVQARLHVWISRRYFRRLIASARR